MTSFMDRLIEDVVGRLHDRITQAKRRVWEDRVRRSPELQAKQRELAQELDKNEVRMRQKAEKLRQTMRELETM